MVLGEFVGTMELLLARCMEGVKSKRTVMSRNKLHVDSLYADRVSKESTYRSVKRDARMFLGETLCCVNRVKVRK
jgi:hypothetical protein